MTQALLEQKVDEFANSLVETLFLILEIDAPISSLVSSDGGTNPTGVVGSSEDPFNAAAIPLTINNEPALTLFVEYACGLDNSREHLKIKKSKFEVRSAIGEVEEPLFRIEYEPQATSKPVSHLHVHAHRDELVYLRMLSHRKKSRAGKARSKSAVNKLSGYHFPTGGHRFRPCLEDLLQSLILELDIDVNQQDWQRAIEQGRQDFRQRQLKAAVRHQPECAADSLRALGYKVDPPHIQSQKSISNALHAF